MDRNDAGFAYFEALIALVMVAIAMAALAHTLADTGSTMRRMSEKQLAMQTALDTVEEVKARGFEEILPTYAPGGLVGPEFPLPIFNGTALGRVDFVTDETLDDEDLPLDLGFPRDLDGDGRATNPDVTATARTLVGVVSVSWGPPTAPQTWRVPVVVRRRDG